MLINVSDIWGDSVKAAHKKFVEELIIRKYDAIVSPILQHLVHQCCDDFACGTPGQLCDIIDTAEYLCRDAADADVQSFLDESARLFNYSKFAAKHAKGWNAYALCGAATCKVCPYCQQAAAIAIRSAKSGKSFRPTLDHFYSKSNYPYLALSLYNLIPSCQTCNSSLKGQIDFAVTEHLHPYEDDEIVRYEWDFKAYIASRLSPSALVPAKIIVGLITLPPGHFRAFRAAESIKTFMMVERLEFNLPSLESYMQVLSQYSSLRIEEVNQKALGLIPLSQKAVLQFDPENYRNEMLGRLKKDLFNARWR